MQLWRLAVRCLKVNKLLLPFSIPLYCLTAVLKEPQVAVFNCWIDIRT